jgi:ubiquinone/menaquinone biosynthesis C-methylase UbiE
MDSVKLHLGCGKRRLPGFIHIDQDQESTDLDYCQDISNLSNFDDNSVDEIYSCGTIVYFDRYEVIDVLKEWRRVLKVGGKLRTSMADFKKMVEVYHKYGDLDVRGILGPLFGRWEIKEEGVTKVIYQKTSYDFNSFEKVLLDNGFKNVKTYRWQDFLPPEYDDYSRAYIPHMDESGLLLSLNVVCEKV